VDARRKRITAKAEADAELNGCAGAGDGPQGLTGAGVPADSFEEVAQAVGELPGGGRGRELAGEAVGVLAAGVPACPRGLERPDLPLGHSLVLAQRDDKKRPAHGEDPHDADTPGTPEPRALVSQSAIAGGARATVSLVPYGQLPVRS
jgi:hypothetical protein